MERTVGRKVIRLKLAENSSALNSLHYKVLHEKREEFQRLLCRRRDQFEAVIQKAAERSGTRTHNSPQGSDASITSNLFNDAQADDCFSETPVNVNHPNDSSSRKSSASPTNPARVRRPSTSTSPVAGDSCASLRTENISSRRQRELEELQQDLQNRLFDLCDRFHMDEANESTIPTPGFGDSLWGRRASQTGLTSDSIYLVETVGDALRQAVGHVCLMRPHDPIETLGTFLHAYAAEKVRKHKEEVERLKTRLEEEEDAMLLDRKHTMLLESQRINMEDERRKQMFLKRTSEIKLELLPSVEKNPEIDEVDRITLEAEDAKNPPVEVSDSNDAEQTTEPSASGPTLYTIEEGDAESITESTENTQGSTI